jgi:hypothetical protein
MGPAEIFVSQASLGHVAISISMKLAGPTRRAITSNVEDYVVSVFVVDCFALDGEFVSQASLDPAAISISMKLEGSTRRQFTG